MILIVLLIVALALFGMPLFSVLAVVALLSFRAAGIDTAAVIVEMNRRLADRANADRDRRCSPSRRLPLCRSRIAAAPRPLLARPSLRLDPRGLAIRRPGARCAVFTAFTGASGVHIIASGRHPLSRRAHRRRSLQRALLARSPSPPRGAWVSSSRPLCRSFSSPTWRSERSTGSSSPAFVPGVLLIVMLALYGARMARGVPRQRFTAGEVLAAARGAAWELPLPLAVLGGIYSGNRDHHRGGGAHRLLRPGGRGAHLSRHHPPPAGPRIMKESMLLVAWHPDHPRRRARAHQLPDRRRGAVQDLRLDAAVRAVEARLLADAQSLLLVWAA